MQIGRMPRQEVLDTLERRRTHALTNGDKQRAQSLQEDLTILRGAPGEDLFEIYTKGVEASERHDHIGSGGHLGRWSLGGTATGAVGAVVFWGVRNGLGLKSGVTAGLIGGIAGFTVGTFLGIQEQEAFWWRDDPGIPIQRAATRTATLVAEERKNPTLSIPEVPREKVLKRLETLQENYLSNGQLAEAYEMQAVHQFFSKHDKMTLLELHAHSTAQGSKMVVSELQNLLKDSLAEEELRQLISGGADDGTRIEWQENNIDVGDQSVERK